MWYWIDSNNYYNNKPMHEDQPNIMCLNCSVPIVYHHSVISACYSRQTTYDRHNTPIHNILSTAPQSSISQKALGTFPEDGNVMPKHVGATIHN
jgi:hypothetical protein